MDKARAAQLSGIAASWERAVEEGVEFVLLAGKAALSQSCRFLHCSQSFFSPRDVTGKEPTDVVSGGRNYCLSTMSAMFERYECSKPPSCGVWGCPPHFFNPEDRGYGQEDILRARCEAALGVP